MDLSHVIDIIRKDPQYSKLTVDKIIGILELIIEHDFELEIKNDVLDLFLHVDYIQKFLDEKYEIKDLDIFMNLVFDNSEIKKYLKKKSIDFGDDDDDDDDDDEENLVIDVVGPKKLIICNLVISVLTFISVFVRR